MPIEWRDQLSVGNDIVDDDHKTLIGIVNEFEHALTTKDADEVADVFRRLLKYTEEHFEREEALQTAVHFPERKAHKEEHLRLKWTLQDIRDQFAGKEYESLSELKDLLRNGLLHHILEEDMKMAPYLKGRRT